MDMPKPGEAHARLHTLVGRWQRRRDAAPGAVGPGRRLRHRPSSTTGSRSAASPWCRSTERVPRRQAHLQRPRPVLVGRRDQRIRDDVVRLDDGTAVRLPGHLRRRRPAPHLRDAAGRILTLLVRLRAAGRVRVRHGGVAGRRDVGAGDGGRLRPAERPGAALAEGQGAQERPRPKKPAPKRGAATKAAAKKGAARKASPRKAAAKTVASRKAAKQAARGKK